MSSKFLKEKKLPYNADLKSLARSLRQSGNVSEAMFWNKVKKRQFKGYQFKRQKIIGNYIVDFFCEDCRVVIEIDGFSHKLKGEYDEKRDAYLRGLGLVVIRLDVKEVMNDINGVIQKLYYHDAFLKAVR